MTHQPDGYVSQGFPQEGVAVTDVEQIAAWFDEQAEKEQALLDTGRCNNRSRTQERWLVYKASAQSVRDGAWRSVEVTNTDVACPKCERPPGEGCVFTLGGQDAPEGFVHNERAVAARDSALKKANAVPVATPTPPSTVGSVAVLWQALESYGHALRLQDKLTADLDRVKSRGDAVVMPTEMRAIAQQHGDACDALVDAEIELLARAAVVGGCRPGTRQSRASTSSTQHLRVWNAIDRMGVSAESVAQKAQRPLVTLSESVERASPGSLELRVEVKLLGHVVEHYTGHPDHVRAVAAIKAREVEGVATELLKDRGWW